MSKNGNNFCAMGSSPHSTIKSANQCYKDLKKKQGAYLWRTPKIRWFSRLKARNVHKKPIWLNGNLDIAQGSLGNPIRYVRNIAEGSEYVSEWLLDEINFGEREKKCWTPKFVRTCQSMVEENSSFMFNISIERCKSIRVPWDGEKWYICHDIGMGTYVLISCHFLQFKTESHMNLFPEHVLFCKCKTAEVSMCLFKTQRTSNQPLLRRLHPSLLQSRSCYRLWRYKDRFTISCKVTPK